MAGADLSSILAACSSDSRTGSRRRRRMRPTASSSTSSPSSAPISGSTVSPVARVAAQRNSAVSSPSRPTASIAAIVLLAVIVIYCGARWFAHGRRDGFVSRRAQEVYQTTRELFDRTGGAATYSEYKTTLSDVDPVLYTDVHRLWREGRLSPEEVAKVL